VVFVDFILAVNCDQCSSELKLINQHGSCGNSLFLALSFVCE
jgi:hypothetical protein